MSARNILQAILSKDSEQISRVVEKTLHTKVMARIEEVRTNVGKTMFVPQVYEGHIDLGEDNKLLEYEVVRGSDGGYYDDEGNRFGGRARYGKQPRYNTLASYEKMRNEPATKKYGWGSSDKPTAGVAPGSSTDVPHEVHINGRFWKAFPTKAHAEKIKASMEASPAHKGKRVEIRPGR